ncbi:ADP-ribosyl-[dinitrogen reductase] glycohydrolase, partial [Durusdinium trenchii]
EEYMNDLDSLLRVSAGGTRDYIIPAKCLDQLPSRSSSRSSVRELLQKHAIASIPGSGLNHIDRCNGFGKIPVCMAGEGLEEIAKKCEDSGLKPEVLCSKEGCKFFEGSRENNPFVSAQSLTMSENGKRVPFLKPRTRLSADDRSKLRLPDVSRRKVALDFSSSDAAATKVVLIDDDEAAKSRAENAVSAILQQIDFIVSESMGFFGPVEDLSYGNSALYSSLEVLHLLPVPEPPELSLLHEELGASCASVAQEFPQNIVPPERRADTTSAETGTLRAKAVRIRGSPDSAYPFMKGGDKMPEISTTMKQEMLVADPGGIEE